MRTCPNCRNYVDDSGGVCPVCRTSFYAPPPAPVPLQFCTSCGRQITPGSGVCPYCNAVQPNLSAPIHVGMSFKDWLIAEALLLIPIAGIVLLFIWAFDSTTAVTKKNWAKAYLVIYAVTIALAAIAFFFLFYLIYILLFSWWI